MARACWDHAEMLDSDPDPAVVLYAARMPIEHERNHPDAINRRKLSLLASRRLTNSETRLTAQHVTNSWAAAVEAVRAAHGTEPSARPGYRAQASPSPSMQPSPPSQLYRRFSFQWQPTVTLPNRSAAPTAPPATPSRASTSVTPHHSTHAPPFPPLSRLGSSGAASPDPQLVQAQITSLVEGQTAAFEAIAASQQARPQLRVLAVLPMPTGYPPTVYDVSVSSHLLGRSLLRAEYALLSIPQ